MSEYARREDVEALRDALAALSQDHDLTTEEVAERIAEIRTLAEAADRAINHPPIQLRERMSTAEAHIQRNREDAARQLAAREATGLTGAVAQGEGTITRLSGLTGWQFARLIALVVVLGALIVLGVALWRGSLTIKLGGTTIENAGDVDAYGPVNTPRYDPYPAPGRDL